MREIGRRWSGGRDVRLRVAVVMASGVFGGLLWLLLALDSGAVESIKTAGLGAGSVVALYALWLNDRRRQVEEGRHEHDQQRVADERFAKAVEMLGHEADQVRVGALHALAGVAGSRPEYTQTVLDVVCAYLRRPFRHPRYDVATTGDGPDRRDRDLIVGSDGEERELQVRLTAIRLLRRLTAEVGRGPAYDLDLTGANLEYLDLSRRELGELTLRYAVLHSTTRLNGAGIERAWFSHARFGPGRRGGRLLAKGVRFGRAWFPGTVFEGPVRFDNARFEGPVLFDDVEFARDPVFLDVHFEEPPNAMIAGFAERAARERGTGWAEPDDPHD